MPPTRPTRRDVAARAGVAPSTVTLVLNNRGEGLGVSEATCQRIRDAARELGYYPNFHIRSIRSGRTGNIGLYLRDDQWGVSYGYWSMVLAGLQRATAIADKHLLMHCALPDCSTEDAFARQAGGVVDGVVIINSGNDPIAQRLLETGLPAVEIGDSFSPLPLVAVDSAMGIRLIMQHLVDRGYKRPVLVNIRSTYVQNADQKWQVFREYAESQFGLDPSSQVMIDVADGAIAFRELWAMNPRPDVAVCTSDEMALGVVTVARANGLRVPQDLAVTGFDCIALLEPETVTTSIYTPVDEMTKLGIEKLLRLIDGLPVERKTILPVSLRVGGTT